jgi:hypothetical protein
MTDVSSKLRAAAKLMSADKEQDLPHLLGQVRLAHSDYLTALVGPHRDGRDSNPKKAPALKKEWAALVSKAVKLAGGREALNKYINDSSLSFDLNDLGLKTEGKTWTTAEFKALAKNLAKRFKLDPSGKINPGNVVSVSDVIGPYPYHWLKKAVFVGRISAQRPGVIHYFFVGYDKNKLPLFLEYVVENGDIRSSRTEAPENSFHLIKRLSRS